ncbi:membrane protein insertase YidC [Endothiovibrio diazotrophicus]
MDNQRLILFVAFSFILLFIWQQWKIDYGPRPPAAATTQAPSPVKAESATSPISDADTDLPGTPATADLPAAAKPAASTGKRILVVTDMLDLEIDTVGGTVRRADLRHYPVSIDDPTPFRLLDDEKIFHVAQSGLLGSNAPDHHAHYTAEQEEYRLADGSDTLVVPLVWHGENGVTVTKRFVFHRGAYDVEVEHVVNNAGGAPWSARQYRQLQRTDPGSASMFLYTYTGGAIYSPKDKYEKIKFPKMKEHDLSREIQGGWAAMIQHYFVVAWIPQSEESDHYYAKSLSGGRYAIGMVSPEASVPAGGEHTYTSKLFTGPKIQKMMADLAPGLDLTVDYGILTVIAKPLFGLMNWLHGVFGNWGWAIITVTLMLKLLFYKLSETSYKSMANMRKLQPRLQKLKELYGDDKQKMNEKMMEIYKTEKINPLGGCLPIVVQIPVFIALYWVLLETVEMRQAPWILWINDLSTKDPYYVLPVIMGITMVIQQKLNPAPIDPLQAKIMMTLPLVFTVFFAFFPSGLVLYWVVNSGLSIAQQWVITKRIEAANT